MVVRNSPPRQVSRTPRAGTPFSAPCRRLMARSIRLGSPTTRSMRDHTAARRRLPLWTASAMTARPMADPPLLALSGIRFHLGDQTILDGVELGIAPGERLSLVGRNGAGKSTLLRILAGEPIADGGTRFAQPGATIATLPQEPDFSGHASVGALCRLGAPRFAGPVRLPRRRHPRGDEARRRPRAGRAVGRRGAPRGAGARAGRRARRAAARRADQPSRPADHRMAGGQAVALARRLCAGEPRPALPQPIWRAPCCGSTAASCAGSTGAMPSSTPGRPTSSSARRPSGTSSTG